MKKFQVGFLANGELFETVVEARTKSEAFCNARYRAESWYFSNGVNCVSSETYAHKDSYVIDYVEPTEAEMLEIFNDPLLADIV